MYIVRSNIYDIQFEIKYVKLECIPYSKLNDFNQHVVINLKKPFGEERWKTSIPGGLQNFL